MNIEPQSIFEETDNVKAFDTWLRFTEIKLEENDYLKYNQSYKNSDFQYWKTYNVEGKKAYQVGVLFYDFRKYTKEVNAPDKISVQFECLLVDSDGNIGLSVSKDNITLKGFEDLAKDFYYSTSTKIKHITNQKTEFINDEIRPIIKQVMEDYNITNNRERENVYKRKYIYYFLRNELKRFISFEKIGFICGYNHATVVHHERDAREYLKSEDIVFLKVINSLKSDLFSRFEKHLKK